MDDAADRADLDGTTDRSAAKVGITDRPVSPLGSATRWVRGRLRDEPTPEALAAVDDLIPAPGHRYVAYLWVFGWLTVLSAGIASFGLLADSSAVVIGAMLVAPLMTPITAAAAATVMARNARLFWAMATIGLGTGLAIAVGWTVSAVAGSAAVSEGVLPGEVLARTFPGLLDLGIAITAGAAAGYILPRRSAVSALPGVGIAVALVPPLATVGITAELGFGDLAREALLLYLTNLAAIIFAASVVLLLDGFRPHQVTPGRGRLRLRIGVTVAAVAAVAIPLTLHTRATVIDQRVERAVNQAVAEWDPSVDVLEVEADVVGGTAEVSLVVTGPNEARPAWRLAELVRVRFDGPVDLELRYQRTERFDVSAR